MSKPIVGDVIRDGDLRIIAIYDLPDACIEPMAIMLDKCAGSPFLPGTRHATLQMWQYVWAQLHLQEDCPSDIEKRNLSIHWDVTGVYVLEVVEVPNQMHPRFPGNILGMPGAPSPN